MSLHCFTLVQKLFEQIWQTRGGSLCLVSSIIFFAISARASIRGCVGAKSSKLADSGLRNDLPPNPFFFGNRQDSAPLCLSPSPSTNPSLFHRQKSAFQKPCLLRSYQFHLETHRAWPKSDLFFFFFLFSFATPFLWVVSLCFRTLANANLSKVKHNVGRKRMF